MNHTQQSQISAIIDGLIGERNKARNMVEAHKRKELTFTLDSREYWETKLSALNEIIARIE